MPEFNVTGFKGRVDEVLAKVPHRVVDVWTDHIELKDVNVEVHDDYVDDLYEHCEEVNIACTLV